MEDKQKLRFKTEDNAEKMRLKRLNDLFDANKCKQCNKNSAFLVEVCLSCCKKNHKKAMGR